MILLPSLDRPVLLKNFFKAFKQAEGSLPGLVLVDKEDPSRELYTEIEYPKNWELVITDGVTMGEKVSEVWSRVENLEWVGIINDDHEPVTKHFDTLLVAQLNGTNFVSCSDRWMAPMKAAGLTVFSMPLLKAWGFPIFPKGITHMFIDDVFESIGISAGCWDIEMSVVVLHKHVLKRESPMDKTHSKTYYRGWQTGPERQAFEKFMKEELPGVVERTIALKLKES